MARNRNLFDDTTMSFGDHLEVLRVHLWKSLVGIAIGIVISMFIGNRIIGILKARIDKALREANVENVVDDVAEGRLVVQLQEWNAIDRHIVGIYQHRRHLSAKLRLFTQFLTDYFKREEHQLHSR